MHRTVCTPRLGPHLSRLVHSEHVPLAVLAYEWDVLDFEQDEAPRIEFVQAFSKGIWRDGGKRPAMRMDRGFYRRGRGRVRRFVSHPEGEEVLVMSSWQRLKAYMVGVPMLLFLVALTVAVMISIFSFRMLMRLATQVLGTHALARSHLHRALSHRLLASASIALPFEPKCTFSCRPLTACLLYTSPSPRD